MATQPIDELVTEWRARGPVEWAEGAYGWIGIDGEPVTLSPWQRAVLSAWWDNRETVSTFAISNIKKTGKTFINGVLLAWRWLALPGLHFAVANDLDQSTSRQFAEIAEMVRRNDFLRQNVKVSAKTLEFTPTGSVLQALAGDATGNAGANHLTVSHTETWGIIYEQDIRNFEELTPPPGRFFGLPPLRVADSYAGYLDESNTWHDLVDRGLMGDQVSVDWPIFQDGGLLLFHMVGDEAQRRCYRGSPGEAMLYYRDQRATLRANAYKRLHENQRTVNIGSFIDQEHWESLIDANHHPLPAGSPQKIYIGLDLAIAPGGDNCALIGVYFDEGKVKVAFHKVWQGGRFRLRKLQLSETVEPYILNLAKKYNVVGCWFDPWQAVHLAERLRAAGVRAVEVKQTHQSRGPKDTALYDLASGGRLVLYDDPELKNATAGANAKELGNGLLFLQKSGGRSKIDLLVALSNAADVCDKTGQGFSGVSMIRDPFGETWPPREGDIYDPRRGWVEPNKHKKHSRGATSWRDCRYRTKGCDECEAELQAERYFEKEAELVAAITPMSEAEYNQWEHNLRHPQVNLPISDEERQANLAWHFIVSKVKKENQYHV